MNPPVPPQRPPMDTGLPVGFDRRSAERTRDSVLYFERHSRNRVAGLKAGDNGFRETAIARVTTTITAASGATYGSGAVTFCKDTGSALADDTPTGVTVYNFTDKAWASGSTNYVSLKWMLGKWWVDVPAKCSMLS